MRGDGLAAVSLWRWLNPFASRRYILLSPLGPDLCAQCLREHLVVWRYPANLFAWPRVGQLDGSVTPRGFAVVRYRRWQRNSFKPLARGTFIPDPCGTRIDIRVGMSPVVAVFLVLWAGMFFAIATLPWLTDVMIGRGGTDVSSWPGPFLAAMPLLAIVLVVVGRWWARGDEAFLLDLLGRTFEARNPEATHGRS